MGHQHASQKRFTVLRREKVPAKPAAKKFTRQLACPFYLTSPSAHLDCAKHAQLKTTTDLIDHLWYRHRQPFYCPACKNTFETAAKRDSHIVERSCDVVSSSDPRGISEDQRRQLSRKVRGNSEWRRYESVWRIAFPKENTPATPYLQGDLPEAVSQFRRYWKECGRASLHEYIHQKSLDGHDLGIEEEELPSLYSRMETEIIDTLVTESFPGLH